MAICRRDGIIETEDGRQLGIHLARTIGCAASDEGRASGLRAKPRSRIPIVGVGGWKLVSATSASVGREDIPHNDLQTGCESDVGVEVTLSGTCDDPDKCDGTPMLDSLESPAQCPEPVAPRSLRISELTYLQAFRMQVTETDWIVDSVVARRGITILSGDPKCGKTFLTLDMALGVATGTTFLGFKCDQGNVLYVDLENDLRTIVANRIKKIGRGRELGESDEPLVVRQPGQLILDTSEHSATLRAYARLARSIARPHIYRFQTGTHRLTAQG